MIVNFEFLGDEPIENVITCMNHKVDRVVFFGYHDMIEKHKSFTRKFLENDCGVKEVSFVSLSTDKMDSVLDAMRRQVKNELSKGNKVYFDITGGEDMILVAFGMLAKEFNTPMHMYKVETNERMDLNCDVEDNIGKSAEEMNVKFDLKQFIRMHGGAITNKYVDYMKYKDDVYAMWNVVNQYRKYWNLLSEFMRSHMVPDAQLKVCADKEHIKNMLSNKEGLSLKILEEMLAELEKNNVILDYKCENGTYSYRFKNQDVKDWMWKSGTLLELYVYFQERKKNDDCRRGTSLDWDGIINDRSKDDVWNEIDVLSLKGNVLTFISCKGGKDVPKDVLYEIETVAERMGGKYARKALAVLLPMSEAVQNRAAEMGIEIWQL